MFDHSEHHQRLLWHQARPFIMVISFRALHSTLAVALLSLASPSSALDAAAVLPQCEDGTPHAVDGAPSKKRFLTRGGSFKCASVAGLVPVAQCLNSDDFAGTRCCDDDNERDLSSSLCPAGACAFVNDGTSLCPKDTCDLVTFAAAKGRCEAIGMRLCTTEEILEENKAQGSGCGFDYAPVWTLPANLSIANMFVAGDNFMEVIAQSGTVLYQSTSGIYFTPLPSSGYDIETTVDGEASQVAFKLVDETTGIARFGIDTQPPFSLKGAFHTSTFTLESTDYTLTARPFSVRGGLEGISSTVRFSVVDEPFNPVKEPVRLTDERGTNVLRLKRIASFPTEFEPRPLFTSRILRINCLIPRGEWLYACMESIGIIRKVDVATGSYETWFDVFEAISNATNGERELSNQATFPHSGLRGLAFDEDFENNGRFYTSHLETHPSDTTGMKYLGAVFTGAVGDSVVAEWTMQGDGSIPASSYRQLFRIAMPTFPEEGVAYENPIKQIAMLGGYLLVCMGDGYIETVDQNGGRGNDPFGKILRIDPKGTDQFDYSIPDSNPFIDSDKYPSEAFAVGFRNPHNLGITEKDEILVTDTGRDNAEEVNIVVAGGDYGWNEREGPFVHNAQGGGLLVGVGIDLPANDATFNYTYPAALWGHEGGKMGAAYQEVVSQSIAGSCPIAENAGTELDGRFFYGDFPEQGPIYYSYLDDMRQAMTQGDPSLLTHAPTYLATLEYYDENDALVMSTIHFRDIVLYEAQLKGLADPSRNDMRFGCGPNGELLISSKRDGNIYTVLNSHPASGSD